MIEKYMTRFSAEDLSRILRFAVLYIRAEYAIKRVFPKKGPFDRVEPNWKEYAQSIDPAVVALRDDSFARARDRLLASAPRQYAFVGNETKWIPNPRRASEQTDAEYLLRVVRDVRNNLFHGGKYPAPDNAPEELARDRDLIDAGAGVLEQCLELNAAVKHAFEETV